jgi:hypothetical protein
MKVCISQFRKDYLTFIKKEKGKALRKKVMAVELAAVEGSGSSIFVETIVISVGSCSDAERDVECDNSIGKGHYILKSELAVNKELLSSSSFTKNSLLLIGKAYGVKLTLRQKRGEIVLISICNG